MKRFALIILAFCLSQISYSQNNSFPTTGPVYIGNSLSLDGDLHFGSNNNIHLGSNSKLFNSDGFNLISWNSGGLKIGEEGYDYYLNIFGFGSKVTFNDAGIEYHSSGRHLFFGGGLEVYSDISSSGNIKLGSNKSILDENGVPLVGRRDGIIEIGDDSDNNVRIWGFGGSNIFLYDGQIDYYSNGYHQFLGGSVGIGTIPNFKLDVDGDINISPGHTFKIGGVPFTGSKWLTSTNNNIYYNTGNVGIGTTTPAAKLDVNGDISLSGNLKLGDGKSLFDQSNRKLIGYDGSTLRIGDDGRDAYVNIYGFGNSIDFGDGYISYNAAGFAEHNATYHNFATGSVGIGTTPNNKLEINHGTPGNSGLRFTQLNSASPTTSGNGKVLSVNANGDVILTDGGGNTVYPGAGIPISTGSAWGTSIPNNSANWNYAYSYSQIGHLPLEGGDLYGGITFHENASDFQWYLCSSYNDGDFIFNENGGATRLILKKGGNVGVGTIAPNNRLEIDHGTAGNSGLRFTQLRSTSPATTGNGKFLSVNSTGDVILVDGNSSTPTWNLTGNSGTNSSSQFIGTTDAQDLVIKTNNVEKLRVKSNGKIGIGNSNPDLLLTIGGGQEPSSGIRLFDNYDGTEFWDFIVEQQVGLKIKYGTTTPFFINGFGNVGIGTTNPTTKLAVNGSIKTKEVIITLDGWSDFVFHSSYRLRTLGEVEKFIKTNNHLPEIPTESEVKQNGISVGEMNAKLLQKIEELTLYVIDLQKQVNELKSKK